MYELLGMNSNILPLYRTTIFIMYLNFLKQLKDIFFVKCAKHCKYIILQLDKNKS